MSYKAIKNAGYVSSDMIETTDTEGYFTTTEDDQIIDFRKEDRKFYLSAIRIFAKDMPLKIQINEHGVLHIKPFEIEGVEGMEIRFIKVLGAKGQLLKYDGFFY